MFNKNSRIYLCIASPINDIICYILRNFGLKNNSTVIQFCDFSFFRLTVYLFLFWIYLVSSSKPCFCYP
jgi:hypothetical protein